MVSGVRHTSEVLDLFTSQVPEWGPADAGRRLGISRSHAHRLLSTLAELGLLERRPATGRYRVGARCLVPASVLLDSNVLFSSGVQIMRSLSTQFDVAAALSVRDRDGVLTLQPEADPLIVRRRAGDCVAVDTVLLAGRCTTEIDEVLDSRDPCTADAGMGAAETLRRRIERVRGGGLIGALRPGEPGSVRLAAPVVDAGAVVAALSVEVQHPRWRILEQELARVLRDAARRLSADIAAV